MARSPFRFATWMLPLLLPVSLGSALAVADDPVAAIPVSPGDSQAGALIGDPCPSFSWGAVAGAQRYELAIFDAQWDDSPGYEDQLRQGVALRRIEIDAPALSWTPAGSECLDEGGSYLWFVRAETAAREEPWSAPRYFEIDYDADALTQTVRRELAAQLSQPEVWREVIQAALSGNRALALTPLASAAMRTAAATDTATRAGGTGATSGWETSAISPQATTFPNPSALKIRSANGVVFDQSATGGGIPAEGDGTRFMWYPGKGAIRAGYTGGGWDDAYIGLNSSALGSNTVASGDYSTAMGYFTGALGEKSTALGSETTASVAYDTAMGRGTTASGGNSTAMGSFTTASGQASTAMGLGATASGPSSTAMGEGTTASEYASTAMGYGTIASQWYSTAMGVNTAASGAGSTAMGIGTTASGHYSTAMGYFTAAESDFELVIGELDTPFMPTGGVTDRLFVIGNGTATDARSDALRVLRNGNLTIAGQAYKPGGGTWQNSSDRRLKDILGEYRSGLDTISALQPVRYHYAVNNARGHDPKPVYVGFVAQQVQGIIPEAVSEDTDGYLNLDMHTVNVAMVNAIKTLREQNQDLHAQHLAQEAQIAALQADKAILEHRLVSLEAEQRRSVKLYADIASLQAQMQVLQGQMIGATDHSQVAFGR